MVDPAGVLVLQTFELDYRGRLDRTSGPGGAPVPPGAIRSAWYAVIGLVAFLRVLTRPAKGWRSKAQLLYGLLAVGALVLCAAVAVAAALAAMGAGGWLPDGVGSVLGVDSTDVAVATGVVAVGTWAALRRRLLAIAWSAQRNIRYLDEDGHRDTVVLTLDTAVDGLRDSGWSGPVHLLGYSFGSLVAVDALMPASTRARPGGRVAEAVRTLTTIGCPADVVRLYRQGYLLDRVAHVPDLDWVNVFIPADVFASNLRDGGDDMGGGQPVVVATIEPRTVQYGNERLGWRQIATIRGFRTHGGYWGGPDEANCFEDLVDRWITPAAPPAAPSTSVGTGDGRP